jgi:hypothetical protein
MHAVQVCNGTSLHAWLPKYGTSAPLGAPSVTDHIHVRDGWDPLLAVRWTVCVLAVNTVAASACLVRLSDSTLGLASESSAARLSNHPFSLLSVLRIYTQDRHPAVTAKFASV